MGTKIYNSNLTKEIQDVVKLQTSTDPTPSEIADKVILVADVNPKHARIINHITSSGQATSGTNTIFTTPTDRDYYLIGCQVSLQKDILCDNTNVSLICTLPGGSAALSLLDVGTISVTPTTIIIAREFPVPILIKRGSSINLTGTFTAGAMNRRASINGYFVENINA